MPVPERSKTAYPSFLRWLPAGRLVRSRLLPGQTVVLAAAALILIGSAFLMLPFALLRQLRIL